MYICIEGLGIIHNYYKNNSYGDNRSVDVIILYSRQADTWVQKLTNLGALDGGVPMSHVELKKMAMSHVSVANKSLCPLSNLRNGNVACHYRFPPFCCVARAPCRMSNLRNGPVAVSNLVVQTHNLTRPP